MGTPAVGAWVRGASLPHSAPFYPFYPFYTCLLSGVEGGRAHRLLLLGLVVCPRTHQARMRVRVRVRVLRGSTLDARWRAATARSRELPLLLLLPGGWFGMHMHTGPVGRRRKPDGAGHDHRR